MSGLVLVAGHHDSYGSKSALINWLLLAGAASHSRPLHKRTQSFGDPSCLRTACASELVTSNMNAGAQGACSTVNEVGSGEGRIVALGPRSGGAFDPGSRSPIRYGPTLIASGSAKVELSHVAEIILGG